MSPESLLNEANRLRNDGRLAEALSYLEQAIARSPGDLGTLLTLGVTLLDLERGPEAIAPLEKLVAGVPQLPQARNILASALLASGRPGEAHRHILTALELQPDQPAALENLGRCLRGLGRMDEALRAYDAAASASPLSTTHSNALLAAQYVAGLSLHELTTRAINWAQRHTAPWSDRVRPGKNLPLMGRRLRVGYVSPDFRQHAVALFLEPVIAAHDASAVEIFCYACNQHTDGVTDRFRSAAHHWRDIARLDEDAAAACIGADRIDVLVDLAGHTANHRLGVFARRPASCQISWLGYPATTGLSAMDFRVTDDACIPADGNDARHGTERLIRLPDVFCCYQAPASTPPVTPLPCLSGAPFTFVSANALPKISPITIKLWAAILSAVPDSRLCLYSPGANDAQVQAWFHQRFAEHGIAAARVVFNGDALPVREHLSRYAAADLALDPMPYAGTTTTCEALLMGVPVISLAGESHVSRVGVSLLRAVNLSECIAYTLEDYVNHAVRLASRPLELADLRASLRMRLLNGPLGQAKTFTRNWERALSTAFDQV